MPDFQILALAMFIGLITLFLYDFKKILTRNIHKLDPKYMNDQNTIYKSTLHLDTNKNTIIKGIKRYHFSRYL